MASQSSQHLLYSHSNIKQTMKVSQIPGSILNGTLNPALVSESEFYSRLRVEIDLQVSPTKELERELEESRPRQELRKAREIQRQNRLQHKRERKRDTAKLKKVYETFKARELQRQREQERDLAELGTMIDTVTEHDRQQKQQRQREIARQQGLETDTKLKMWAEERGLELRLART